MTRMTPITAQAGTDPLRAAARQTPRPAFGRQRLAMPESPIPDLAPRNRTPDRRQIAAEDRPARDAMRPDTGAPLSDPRGSD